MRSTTELSLQVPSPRRAERREESEREREEEIKRLKEELMAMKERAEELNSQQEDQRLMLEKNRETVDSLVLQLRTEKKERERERQEAEQQNILWADERNKLNAQISSLSSSLSSPPPPPAAIVAAPVPAADAGPRLEDAQRISALEKERKELFDANENLRQTNERLKESLSTAQDAIENLEQLLAASSPSSSSPVAPAAAPDAEAAALLSVFKVSLFLSPAD